MTTGSGVAYVRVRSDHVLLTCNFLHGIFRVFRDCGADVSVIDASRINITIAVSGGDCLGSVVTSLVGCNAIAIGRGVYVVYIMNSLSSRGANLRDLTARTLGSVPIRVVSCNNDGRGVTLLIDRRSGGHTLRTLDSALFGSWQVICREAVPCEWVWVDRSSLLLLQRDPTTQRFKYRRSKSERA